MKIQDKTKSILTVATVLALMLALLLALFCQQTFVYGENDVAVRGREQSKYNFLVFGRDNSANLCDVIILLSLDFQSKEITAMQIPRAT